MSNEPKFTKNEWKAVYHHIPEDLLAKMREKNIPVVRALTNDGEMAVVDGKQQLVAMISCRTPFKRGAGGSCQCAERDANAALIAAAPDMYEALLAYRQCHRNRRCCGWVCYSYLHELRASVFGHFHPGWICSG